MWPTLISTLVSLALSQPGEIVAADTEADTDALLAAGRKVVAGLPGLSPDRPMRSYFEIRMGPNQSIGYVVATLKPKQDGEAVVYDYESDTVIISPIQAKIRAQMSARLKPNFEPLSVTMRRGNLLPTGEKRFVAAGAVFGEDSVTITTADMEQRNTRQVDKPEPPVIFGIEMLVQLLDTSDREPFAVREFSANAGGAGILTFSYDTFRDGTLTLITKPEGAELSYQFWYDENEQLLRWTHVSMPLLFVRSTPERVAALKAELGNPLPLEVSLEPKKEEADTE